MPKIAIHSTENIVSTSSMKAAKTEKISNEIWPTSHDFSRNKNMHIHNVDQGTGISRQGLYYIINKTGPDD